MAVRDRAAYMRDYRARRRVEKSRPSMHEACDRRIKELERQLEIAMRTLNRDQRSDLDDIL